MDVSLNEPGLLSSHLRQDFSSPLTKIKLSHQFFYLYLASVISESRVIQRESEKDAERVLIDQNFRKFPVQNRMGEKVSGNPFRNFGQTLEVFLFFGNFEIPEISCSIWHFYQVSIGLSPGLHILPREKFASFSSHES